MASGFAKLKSEVIDKGLCTECGACAGVCPGRRISLQYIDEEPEPFLAKAPCPGDCKICSDICPGSKIPMLDIERMLFGRQRDVQAEKFGIFAKAYEATTVDERIRASSGSGAVATAMLTYAMDKGIVDGVIVTGFDEKVPYRPVGKIVTESGGLTKYARSKYGGSPPILALLNEAVSDRGIGKLAIMGCPCHVHAIRKIQMLNLPRKIAQSIKFAFGLSCGTQFSFEGIKHILFEYCDIDSLDEIEQLDYRLGAWPGGLYVRTKSGREVIMDRYAWIYHCLYPGGWQRHRCTMCLDHNAEVADVVFGSALQPGRKAGDVGWSMAIARTEFGQETLLAAARDNYVQLRDSDIRDQPWVGIEAKKHGSAFRHKTRQRYGIPVPDYGFTLGHDPEKPKRLPLIMPSFGKTFLKYDEKVPSDSQQVE